VDVTTVTVYGPGGYNTNLPNSNIVEQYEQPDPPQAPLEPVGASITLLVVLGVVPITDAANAVGLSPGDLVAEAEAWAVAAALDA
jgi:hypothetical protein